jgi:PST family polysaccharide transporter
MSFPLAKVSRVVASVTYPALCTLHDQDERLRKAYLKVVRYVALVTFPMLTGMFVVAPEFVQLVYGPKWGESVPLLRLFCLVGMSKSVGTLVGNVYLVKGKPQWGLWWNVAYTVTLLIALLLGVRFGTRGVVTAILALTLPSLVVTQYLVNLLIGTSFRQYFWNLRHAICGSALILVCVGMFQLGPLKPSGLWSSLALSAMAGALVYVAYVYIGERHAFKEGIFLARQIARGIRGAPVAATGEVGSP